MAGVAKVLVLKVVIVSSEFGVWRQAAKDETPRKGSFLPAHHAGKELERVLLYYARRHVFERLFKEVRIFRPFVVSPLSTLLSLSLSINADTAVLSLSTLFIATFDIDRRSGQRRLMQLLPDYGFTISHISQNPGSLAVRASDLQQDCRLQRFVDQLLAIIN